MGVYWVTDGVDRCLVGFLPRHLVLHKSQYDGKIAQVVEFLKDAESASLRNRSYKNRGICRAVIIDANT